jgi:hypothetical protein
MTKWFREHQGLCAWVTMIALVVVGFYRVEQVRQEGVQNRDQQIDDLCQTSVEDRIAIRKQAEVLVNSSRAAQAKADPPMTPEQKAQTEVAIKKFLEDSYAAVPLKDCRHKTADEIVKEVEGRVTRK